MSNEAILASKLAIPTLEVFQSMTIATTLIDSTTAEKLPATAKTNRKAIIIQNKHATGTLYLGHSNAVTADDAVTTGGYELGPGDAVAFTLDGSVNIWALASSDELPACTIEFA